jgi:hypothetical protein
MIGRTASQTPTPPKVPRGAKLSLRLLLGGSSVEDPVLSCWLPGVVVVVVVLVSDPGFAVDHFDCEGAGVEGVVVGGAEHDPVNSHAAPARGMTPVRGAGESIEVISRLHRVRNDANERQQ